jgi:GTPase SAR1 family protein
MDDMIQKYLLNQHKSMQEYNLLAGVLAKPYWLLVINDFPAGFSEEAADRLVSIATKGPRCGIHTIISVDKDRRPPHDFDLKNLERASHVAVEHNGRFHLTDERYCNYQFELDQPPDNTRTAALLKVAGTAAKETETIEVPLSEMIVDDQQSPTTAIDGVRVPIGRVGADEIQELYLTGTNFHCLIIGQSGSGKSNLLHTVILSLASRYSPSELDIYLIDFKQGVEFKCYAPSQDQPGLPHASVVAIDSEREFGLSCLRRLKTIMQERGDLFRQADCNGYVEYRQKTGIVLPRIILIVDELHDFFSEDDAICQQAEVLFDHIARECRGFGMNLILCTQSLMGNSTPLKTTLSQFGTRIALRCGEDDSITIFDRDNPAAKYLSRPGEAIYNDANGLKEGNSPIFQVAFSEDEKEHTLRRIVDKLDPSQLLVRFPLVFEGRRPARLRGNSTFESHLQSRPSRQLPGVMQAWVGKPVAIKDPTTVCLTRAESSNLIVVGKNEETACGILLAASIGLAAQCSPSSPGQFEVFNLCMRNSEWVNRPQDFADILPHDIRVRKPRELAEALTELETIVAMRTEEDCTDAHPIFLITFGLHRLRELRSDYSDRDYNEGGLDSVTPSDSLSRILRDGPLVGVHTLSWCDTYSNLRRALETKDIDNFGIRIALQMSDMDSRELLDDYVACKLPDYRAVLLDDNYPGTLEKFIPYEMVTRDTIADIAALMSQKKRRAEET